MEEPGFIGVVDLTVRLSSMNPLGHIDAKKADTVFERAVIQACLDAYDGSANPAELLRRGIVREGPSAKFFHFAEFDEVVRFATTVRSLLVQKRLPFKLCLRAGTLGGRTLRERWTSALDAASGEGEEAQQESEKLLREFGTDDRASIERLFELYLAPGFHDDAVTLALDLERFKGFGIHIDAASVPADGGAKLFFNHFPGATGARSDPVEYLDCELTRNDDDVVTRLSSSRGARTGGDAGGGTADDPDGEAASEDIPIAGSAAMVAGVLDLLRRSFRANPDSSVYYVSLLTTIVRSSNWGELRHLGKPEPLPGGDKRLAAGWQGYPPIFGTLLDQRHRSMLRRVPSIELVAAAVIDQVHAALSASWSSAAYGQSKRIVDPDREDAATAHEAFIHTVRSLQTVIGEGAMRRVLAVPARALDDDRKRAVLAVTSGR